MKDTEPSSATHIDNWGSIKIGWEEYGRVEQEALFGLSETGFVDEDGAFGFWGND
jgi:hypothetical protein